MPRSDAATKGEAPEIGANGQNEPRFPVSHLDAFLVHPPDSFDLGDPRLLNVGRLTEFHWEAARLALENHFTIAMFVDSENGEAVEVACALTQKFPFKVLVAWDEKDSMIYATQARPLEAPTVAEALDFAFGLCSINGDVQEPAGSDLATFVNNQGNAQDRLDLLMAVAPVAMRLDERLAKKA